MSKAKKEQYEPDPEDGMVSAVAGQSEIKGLLGAPCSMLETKSADGPPVHLSHLRRRTRKQTEPPSRRYTSFPVR